MLVLISTYGGYDMRTGKRLMPALVIGLSMCIGLTGLLATPSGSQAAAYSILHNFVGGANDGIQPYYGGPVLSGSTFYGMTSGGPRSSGPPAYDYAGALFQINANGSGYQFLHYFNNISPGGDGTVPRGSLTLSGATLYGCTAYGGTPYLQTQGTVFKINTNGGGYQVLHNFWQDANHEAHPYGPPIISGSTLYGMTSSESTSLKGEIFALNTDGGGFQVLHQFAGKPADGANPYGSLTLVGSKLYGMTSTGGSGGISGGGPGYGVIFSLNLDPGGEYKVLHNFAGTENNDGAHPYGSLTLVGSKLYGMTAEGGPSGGGVIFSINLGGGEYQVIFDLGSVHIAGPFGSLTLWGSKLYGMASAGGPGGGSGAIFRINPDGTGYQLLHIFKPDQGDGGQPLGDVTFSGSRLYGWTYGGGSAGGGVFFSLQTPQSDTGMMQLLLLD
jgi:uncharacterized repeat protein (TIGR03803 family)